MLHEQFVRSLRKFSNPAQKQQTATTLIALSLLGGAATACAVKLTPGNTGVAIGGAIGITALGMLIATIASARAAEESWEACEEIYARR